MPRREIERAQLLARDRQLRELREKYPSAGIRKVRGGWGAYDNVTATTLDELAARLTELRRPGAPGDGSAGAT